MAAFLVTGNPGSGKTTLAEELSRRGLTAIDSDYVPRLCHYEDDAGNTYSRAEAPLTSDEEWLSTHRWVWSRARLQEVFKGTFRSRVHLRHRAKHQRRYRSLCLRLPAPHRRGHTGGAPARIRPE